MILYGFRASLEAVSAAPVIKLHKIHKPIVTEGLAMKQKIDEEVTLVMYYSSKKRKLIPYRLSWKNREYDLGPVDYYHSYMEGRERQHIFELCDTEATLKFRLRLDCLNLHWILEEIHDGLAD